MIKQLFTSWSLLLVCAAAGPAISAERSSYRLTDDSPAVVAAQTVGHRRCFRDDSSCRTGTGPYATRHAADDPCGPTDRDALGSAGAGNGEDPATGAGGDAAARRGTGLGDEGGAGTDGFADRFRAAVDPRAWGSGSGSQYSSFAHNSIGDMLNMPSYVRAVDWDANSVRSVVPTGQRIKAAENNNPLPQDRVFFNYNHYHHAFQSDSNLSFFSGHYDVPLDNYTLGFEKTFFDGLCSVDVRIPWHSEVSYPFGNFGLESTSNLGDVYIAPKLLIDAWDTGALSIGVGISLPTGGDIHGYVISNSSSLPSSSMDFEIEHKALHLAPFVGYTASPIDRLYLMLWGQLDFDATGNDYITTPVSWLPEFTNTYTLQDSHAAYASMSLAWFLLENRQDSWLEDLAAILELHYSATFGPKDTEIDSGMGGILEYGFFDIDGDIGTPAKPLSILNMTAGVHYQLGGGLNGRIAGVVPLTTGREALFPFELVVQTEWKF